MAKITFKNVHLRIPLIGQSRLFQKKNGKEFTKENLGSSKEVVGNTVYSKILDNLNFECVDGDNIALMGHNGSGKTTLLKVIAKIYHPSSGQIDIEGSVSSLLDVNSILNTDCTGYENIKLFWLHHNKSVDLNSLISSVEEFSELGDFLNMPVKIYSSGMSARLLFSLTTFIKPDILLTDEGIAAGDEAFKKKSKRLMDEYLDSSKIKFFASHSFDFIKKNCNKMFLMKKGSITIFNSIDEGLNYYNSSLYNSNID